MLVLCILLKIWIPTSFAGCWVPYLFDWIKQWWWWGWWYSILGLWYDFEFFIEGIAIVVHTGHNKIYIIPVVFSFSLLREIMPVNFFHYFFLNRGSKSVFPWMILVLSNFCKLCHIWQVRSCVLMPRRMLVLTLHFILKKNFLLSERCNSLCYISFDLPLVLWKSKLINPCW